ncbi:MAG: hypothetical protein H5U08_08430 [Thermogutta sp.]|uniref:hypothetical protein n=1 Tax=Thermogutta sp. TaxID=1962930 RepID=UPI0019BFAB98|nr:hypothetical protein [Thermogutta sp.]MBC7352370.1 hypothetical protein [Thermogutta sp.]
MLQTFQILVALLPWLAALVALIAVGIYVLQKLRREVTSDAAEREESLLDLERLKEEGRLSDAEYRAIAEKMRDSLQGRGKAVQ